MKRNLLVLMIVSLLALVVITACSPKAAAPTAAPAVLTAATAYPVIQEPIPQTVATAYPVTVPATVPATSEKLTDEQLVALIETQLNGHHTMDLLLSKKLTADEWKTVLFNQFHNDVKFTPAEMEQVIAYLIAHQN